MNGDKRNSIREACPDFEARWPTESTGRPIWSPSENDRPTNIAAFIAAHKLETFDRLYQWSIRSPQEFWQAAIDRLEIKFVTPPRQTVDLAQGVETPAWLPDANWNIVESCFSGDPNSTAVILGAPDGGLSSKTVAELQRDVMQVVGSLNAAGLGSGDAIAVMMPMTYESVVIYLGLIAAGCAAVSIADSFAAPEIEKRLRISNAKAIFCMHSAERAGKSINIWQRIREANPPQAIVLSGPGSSDRRADDLRAHDLTWEAFLQLEASTPPVIVHSDSNQTINILFSSGTTGDPKAIPWNQTTPIKCAVDGHFHQDIQPGDVVAWPTNLGWMMGPWLIFAALINRAAIALYEDAPHTPGFGRFVQDARVNMLGIVPTLVRSWRASQSMEGFDWSTIRCFSSTGEASSADDMIYLSWLAGWKPIIEYCGGTEIGGGFISSTLVQPNIAGAFSTPALGSQFLILDESGRAADRGEVFLVPPALGLSVSLLNRDHHLTYFEGTPVGPDGQTLRRHGDHFSRIVTSFGEYYIAGGRVDDTMNLGGIKVSSAEIEQVLNGLEDVSETAAIAVPVNSGPDQLVVFVVLANTTQPDTHDHPKLLSTLNMQLRSRLNPLFKISDVVIRTSLPRTASNKVMRRQLRDEYGVAAE